MALTNKLKSIADAIRGKTGATGTLTLEEMASAISGIPADGLDTSDATATAQDIASGKTAYVNGEKVTGSVSTKESGTTYPSTTVYDYQTVTEDSSYIKMAAKLAANILFRSGSMIQMGAKKSAFGDATAADVVAGKTFTSVAGLKVTGTYESQTDPSGVIEITSNGTHDVASFASANVNVPFASAWSEINEWKVAGIVEIASAAAVDETVSIDVGVSATQYIVISLLASTVDTYSFIVGMFAPGKDITTGCCICQKPSIGTMYASSSGYISNVSLDGTVLSWTVASANAAVKAGSYLVLYRT